MSARAAWVIAANYAVKGVTLNDRVKPQVAAVDAGHLASSYDA